MWIIPDNNGNLFYLDSSGANLAIEALWGCLKSLLLLL